MATTKNVQQLEIALFPNKEVYDKHKSEVKDKICFVSVDEFAPLNYKIAFNSICNTAGAVACTLPIEWKECIITIIPWSSDRDKAQIYTTNFGGTKGDNTLTSVGGVKIKISNDNKVYLVNRGDSNLGRICYVMWR